MLNSTVNNCLAYLVLINDFLSIKEEIGIPRISKSNPCAMFFYQYSIVFHFIHDTVLFSVCVCICFLFYLVVYRDWATLMWSCLRNCVLFIMVWRITCWTCDCQPLPSPKEFRVHRNRYMGKAETSLTSTSPYSRETVTTPSVKNT